MNIQYQERRNKDRVAFNKWLSNKILHEDTKKLLDEIFIKNNQYTDPMFINIDQVY